MTTPGQGRWHPRLPPSVPPVSLALLPRGGLGLDLGLVLGGGGDSRSVSQSIRPTLAIRLVPLRSASDAGTVCWDALRHDLAISGGCEGVDRSLARLFRIWISALRDVWAIRGRGRRAPALYSRFTVPGPPIASQVAAATEVAGLLLRFPQGPGGHLSFASVPWGSPRYNLECSSTRVGRCPAGCTRPLWCPSALGSLLRG